MTPGEGEGSLDLQGVAALVVGRPPLPPGLDVAAQVDLPRGGAQALGSLSPEVLAKRPTHAILAWAELRPSLVLLALRYGCRTFLLVDPTGWAFQSNARGALALASSLEVRRQLNRSGAVRRLVGSLTGRRLLPALVDPAATDATTQRILDAPVRVARPPSSSSLRITHLIGSLGPGGSERQLYHLASASVRLGHRVTVCSMRPLVGADAHYLAPLRAAGVEVRALTPFPAWRTPPPARCSPDVLEQTATHLEAGWIFALLEHLGERPPDVLHGWLDVGNTVSLLAGHLAGVPRVVLALRSLSPADYPAPWPSWWRIAYRGAWRAPTVGLLSNSQAGAESYARFCGLPADGIAVIPNGLDRERLPAALDGAARRAAREALGLDPEAFLVVGVSRLSSEKRPDLFVDVVVRLVAAGSNVQAVHVGTGELEQATHARAAAAGLRAPRLTFLGRREDPHTWTRVADALLLTSDIEGCPNVCIEASALGIPVVATRAGGVTETVTHEETGLLCPVADAEALAAAISRLAADAELAARLGQAGQAFVAERFNLPRMVTATLARYERGARD